MNNSPAIHIEPQRDEDEYDNQIGSIGFQIGNNQSNENRKDLTLTEYNPAQRHKLLFKGIYFQGVCINRNCQVLNQLELVRLGYGSFFFREKVHQSPCPICHVPIHPQTIKKIIYRDAKVKRVGRQSTGKKIEIYDEKGYGEVGKYIVKGHLLTIQAKSI